MPSFSVSDLETITTQPWNIGDPAFAKLVDLVEIGAWYYGCECTGVVTPAPPAYPAFPSGAPAPIKPPQPVTSSTCFEAQAATQWTVVTSGGFLNVTPAWYPNANHRSTVAGSGFPSVTAYQLPAGVTTYTRTTTVSNSASTLNVGGLYYVYFDTNGNIVNFHEDVPANGTNGPFTLGIPNTAVYFALLADLNQGPNGSITSWSMDFSFQCGTAISAITSCCPPDPSLTGQLQQIFNLVQGIFQSLPSPLNSFAESTVHSGLSGNGTVPIGASCIAVKVSITTDIPGAVIDTASPTYYFNRGYIVPITLEAPIAATRKLVYNPQVFMLPKLTEQVGYSLPVGLVVSITELVPGP